MQEVPVTQAVSQSGAASRVMDAFHQLPAQVTVHLADVPNPAPAQPPGTGGVITIMAWVKWTGIIVCVVALIAILVSYAIQSQRGDGGQGMTGIVKVLLVVVGVSAACALVGALVS